MAMVVSGSTFAFNTDRVKTISKITRNEWYPLPWRTVTNLPIAAKVTRRRWDQVPCNLRNRLHLIRVQKASVTIGANLDDARQSAVLWMTNTVHAWRCRRGYLPMPHQAVPGVEQIRETIIPITRELTDHW